MAIKGIAANIPIKGVDFVEYYYTSETDELNQTTHTVTVVFNKHVYGGRFSDTTEANAFNKAKELVKGCLIKSGCFNPNTRIDNIKFRKYGFPVLPLLDVTPDPFNFNGENTISYDPGIIEGRLIFTAVTGISNSIVVQFNNNRSGTIDVYYRLYNTTPPPANTTTGSLSGFYIYSTPISIPNGYSLGLAIRDGLDWDGFTEEFGTLELINTSDSNAILSTLNTHIYPPLGPS